MAGQQRAVCPTCKRPLSVCFCDLIPSPKLTTRFHIHCIQHPNEAKRKALSSVPLLEHALAQFTLEVATQTTMLQDDSSPTVLLFPGPDATILSPTSLRSNLTLVVVDGTWKEAKKIVQHDPRLQSLPRVLVHCDQASLYGTLRKEPLDGCVSTLEAVAEAISVLEGQRDTQATLLRAFGTAVARQQAYVNAGLERNKEFYGGVPKPVPAMQSAAVALPVVDDHDAVAAGYRFYRIERDVAGQRCVFHEERFHGTYAEAMVASAALNEGRPRGRRYGVRLEDVQHAE
ncbi:Aste57867_16408 [Aphanomyces stellatus]|uniref:tRNA-uridine aminocarboxypropyltransferase n=1 Tax=Aphanomyces stellatus TaxID=120398 RepID=A0A485L6C6_9STRA|nr:hypothetical protein As57867_016351 [Aphanomyces stellatus]VFT93183.1 Aste57867_16408 [Aphanomyces stellatus]